MSLDDTVEQRLPDVVTGPLHDGSRITLRQLLQHTSGIGDHVDDQVALLDGATSAAEPRALLERAWSANELIALALAHPPQFAPGEGWAYTDTGYVLIGQVLEAATGEPWQTRVERQLLGPLGSSDTLVPSVKLAIPGAAMHGHAQLPGDGGPSDVTALHPSSLGAMAELFQYTRLIDLKRGEPWLIVFDLAQPVHLLDTTGHWPVRAGGTSSLTNRPALPCMKGRGGRCHRVPHSTNRSIAPSCCRVCSSVRLA